MTNATVFISSFPDKWGALFSLGQPLDMEAFLKSDLLAKHRNMAIQFSITTMVCGLISFIASSLLALYILRSRDGLSTTYHRLMFALSISDMVQSFACAIIIPMVPKEMNYLASSFAIGNSATCDATGFLFALGLPATNLYNSSICIYYLAIIKYNKKDAFIREKMERWLHLVPMLVSIIFGITILATKSSNAVNGAMCFFYTYNPPHCIGYESGKIPDGFSIPCGRGRYAKMVFSIVSPVFFATPVVICVTMTMMYRYVSQIERNLQQYGVGALRLRSTDAPTSRLPAGTPGIHDNAELAEDGGSNSSTSTTPYDDGYIYHIKALFKGMLIRYKNAFSRQESNPPSGNRHVQQRMRYSRMCRKRIVLHRAAGYSFAWFIAYAPFLVRYFSDLIHPVLLIILSCTLPLQGLFNFLVFMSPKVRYARIVARRRRGDDEMGGAFSWCQAFYKAYLSTAYTGQ